MCAWIRLQGRIQLRVVPDRESGLSEVRFWHEGKLLGIQEASRGIDKITPLTVYWFQGEWRLGEDKN